MTCFKDGRVLFVEKKRKVIDAAERGVYNLNMLQSISRLRYLLYSK